MRGKRKGHYNVLARNFKAERPLQKLTTDVGYVYHKQGRLSSVKLGNTLTGITTTDHTKD